MRWIFYFLLLVNLIYFSRSFFTPDPVPQNPINDKSTTQILEVTGDLSVASIAPAINESDVLKASKGSQDELHKNLERNDRTTSNDRLSQSKEWFSNNKEKHCVFIGPHEKEQTAIIDTFLDSHNIEHQFEPVEAEVITGYWVYIDGGFDRPAAVKYMQGLKKRGIDSYVIGESPLVNRVSLGLFKDVENALTRQKQLIKDGFQNVNTSPRVKMIQKNKAQAVILGDLAFDSFKTYLREKNVDIKISENTCI